MAKKKFDLKSMSKRTRSASTGLAQQDEQMHQERESLIVSSVAEIKLDQIKDRSFADTRTLNPFHVLELALSIDAVGLIEPIVVDQEYHLLAGGHRLFALKVLSLESRESALNNLKDLVKKSQLTLLEEQILFIPDAVSIDLHKIPVRIFQFLARDDLAQALQIESIENTQRKDYTSKEVFQLYKRLLKSGYEDVKGRPKKGQRPVKPALSMIIGQSIRSIQRKLKEEESGSSKKNSDHSKAEIISKMACRLNQKLEAANPKTLEKLRENSEFTDQIRKLHKWLENT